MSRVLKPAAVKAGLGQWVIAKGEKRAESWVGFHTFRHTCATVLFENGWNAKQVQLQRVNALWPGGFAARYVEGDSGLTRPQTPENGAFAEGHTQARSGTFGTPETSETAEKADLHGSPLAQVAHPKKPDVRADTRDRGGALQYDHVQITSRVPLGAGGVLEVWHWTEPGLAGFRGEAQYTTALGDIAGLELTDTRELVVTLKSGPVLAFELVPRRDLIVGGLVVPLETLQAIALGKNEPPPSQ